MVLLSLQTCISIYTEELQYKVTSVNHRPRKRCTAHSKSINGDLNATLIEKRISVYKRENKMLWFYTEWHLLVVNDGKMFPFDGPFYSYITIINSF